MNFNLFGKKGTEHIIASYSRVDPAKYEEIWQKVFGDTIKMIKECNVDFKNFAKQKDMTFSIRNFPNILAEFKEYLEQNSSFDDFQITSTLSSIEMKMREVFITNLEKELGFEFDSHSKIVLAQYFFTNETGAWGETIHIIECLKKNSQ